MQQLLARIAAEYKDSHAGPDTSAGPPDTQLINTMSGATLLLDGSVVVKLHRPGTDGRLLAERLRLAPAAVDCLLVPLTAEPLTVRPDGQADAGSVRWATVWPRVEPVLQIPETAPWTEAAALLARLHRTSVPAGVGDHPEHGAVERLERSLDHLREVTGTAADVVRAAAERLPSDAFRTAPPNRPRCLTHGDWHLGQIGRERRPGAPWVLFDLDDLGVGDPVWDLARPAGFRAAGLLPDDDWRAFLDSYRAAGGPAVPGRGDPWPVLDAVARATVVQSAAAGLSRAARQGDPPDEIDQLLVEACARMS